MGSIIRGFQGPRVAGRSQGRTRGRLRSRRDRRSRHDDEGAFCGRLDDGTRWTPTVVFRFRVLFESEVREEEAVRMAVDGRTGRIARHLLAEFPSVLDAPIADFTRVGPIEARALLGIALEEVAHLLLR